MIGDDLSAFFAVQDFAVVAAWTPPVGPAQTAPVLLSTPDELMLGGAVQSRDYQITYPASSLVGLAPGQSLTVAGLGYTVGRTEAIDDGQLMRALLQRT